MRKVKFKVPRVYSVDIHLPFKIVSLQLGVAFNMAQKQWCYNRFKMIERWYSNAAVYFKSDKLDK